MDLSFILVPETKNSTTNFPQEYSHRNKQPKGSKGKTIDNKYCVKTQQEFYVWGFPPSIKLDCDCIYHRHETWDNKYINWWNKRNQSGRYIEQSTKDYLIFLRNLMSDTDKWGAKWFAEEKRK